MSVNKNSCRLPSSVKKEHDIKIAEEKRNAPIRERVLKEHYEEIKRMAREDLWNNLVHNLHK